MKDNITINLLAATEIPLNGKLPSFSILDLKCAHQKLLALPKGKLFIQKISHYLINIDLYEYNIDSSIEVNVTFSAPSMVLVVMLSGHSLFYDDTKQLLKESHGNSCYLSYVPAGTYKRTFLTGQHQLLLLTIPDGVLIEQAKRFSEITPVLEGYQSEKNKYTTLFSAAIAKGMFRMLKKLNTCPNIDGKSFDKKIHNFLLEALNSYNKSLEIRSFNGSQQLERADAFAKFLRLNYANEIVNDRTKLASHFCMSETTMLRLAKKRFGKSLHQHLVELRLLYGLKQLMTTNKPIKEVAESVGYVDPFHFSRAFKQHFNISPSSIDNLLAK